jgi:FixJ family two-component response regulator
MTDTIHVLLVDDQQRFVQNTARLLETRFFHVLTALSGEEALKKIDAREDIDVIVLDVKMPGMDGVETLKAVKRIRPDIEVIMLTGHAALDSGIHAIRLGAFDYLMKPCDIEDLAEKIRAAFDMEQIRRRPVLWKRNSLREVLRLDFLQLPPEADCCDAVKTFCAGVGAPASDTIFVVDPDHQLRGSLSRSGLLKTGGDLFPEEIRRWEDLSDHCDLLKEISVQVALHPELVIAHPEEPLASVAHRMMVHQLSRIAVIDADRIIGVACMRDLLMHIEKEIE